MMNALRWGTGRAEFLESAKRELQRLPVRFLLEHASPDEIFESLETAIVEAGQQHFAKSRPPCP
eukprot:5978330-Pyramimonas_sp.AAC.1